MTMLLCARARFAMDRADEASKVLETTRDEALKYGLRDLASESLRLLAELHSKQGKPQEALRECDEALKIADDLGISDVDYLFTSGDVRFAAGDREGAAGFYGRALDQVGAVFDTKCPRRARQSYLLLKHVPDHVKGLEDLLAGTGREAEARAYKARFGLK
jgi:tetratricopeptide (TPR) repeat protein